MSFLEGPVRDHSTQVVHVPHKGAEVGHLAAGQRRARLEVGLVAVHAEHALDQSEVSTAVT